MKLLVGLGNPGAKYHDTRHNFGFALLDVLATSRRLSFAAESKFKGELAVLPDATHGKIFFLKPATFMNLSGESVAAVCQFYKIDTLDVLAIYDEIDLPLGTIRFARDGSAAGHNGVKSLIQHLGSENFMRLKLGVGRPKHPGLEVADYVLQKFASDEKNTVVTVLDLAEKAVASLLKNGLDATMNVFHQKSK